MVNKLTKLRTCILVVALIATLLCSCSKSLENMTVKEISDIIQGQVKFDNLIEVNKSQISKYFDFKEDLFSDFTFSINESGDIADEYGVFKLNNSEDADRVLEAVSTHLKTMGDHFISSPTEHDKILNGIVRSAGNTVVLIVCSDYETASELLSKYQPGTQKAQ